MRWILLIVLSLGSGCGLSAGDMASRINFPALCTCVTACMANSIDLSGKKGLEQCPTATQKR
jgi:hypothetical protein